MNNYSLSPFIRMASERKSYKYGQQMLPIAHKLPVKFITNKPVTNNPQTARFEFIKWKFILNSSDCCFLSAGRPGLSQLRLVDLIRF